MYVWIGATSVQVQQHLGIFPINLCRLACRTLRKSSMHRTKSQGESGFSGRYFCFETCANRETHFKREAEPYALNPIKKLSSLWRWPSPGFLKKQQTLPETKWMRHKNGYFSMRREKVLTFYVIISPTIQYTSWILLHSASTTGADACMLKVKHGQKKYHGRAKSFAGYSTAQMLRIFSNRRHDL